MRLTGLHLLLTYQCTFECDHCFVWSGPRQTATMTLGQIAGILEQARDLGTIEWIYFEGGEPFLYHAILVDGVRRASDLGFRVGIVSNAYWATDVADARLWLRDLAGHVQDLSLSLDAYHGDVTHERNVGNARAAARALGIPTDTISIAQPEAVNAASPVGQLPCGESRVMYRGRAAAMLAPRAIRRPWESFTECPYEDLREPGRVHVDPYGHVHLCQGISAGNLFETPLRVICESYRPERHPIVGPLLAGGPAELARRFGIVPRDGYADACHLCDETRRSLRSRFPDVLAPDAMYGVGEGTAAGF
jgi:MoaA/NifB/PqqE/SkfB family radical SAM enzyme